MKEGRKEGTVGVSCVEEYRKDISIGSLTSFYFK